MFVNRVVPGWVCLTGNGQTERAVLLLCGCAERRAFLRCRRGDDAGKINEDYTSTPAEEAGCTARATNRGSAERARLVAGRTRPSIRHPPDLHRGGGGGRSEPFPRDPRPSRGGAGGYDS